MSVHAVHDLLRVAFHVYATPGLSLGVAAERLRQTVPVPLAGFIGTHRGEYYRWTHDDTDLLLQRNVPDEDGQAADPVAPVHEVLLYGTNLPEPVISALARVEGLRLLTAEEVHVPAP